MNAASASGPRASVQQAAAVQALKPMGWVETLLSFGIPSLLFVLMIYVVSPWVQSLGVNAGNARYIAGLVITGGLFVAALVRYRLDGNPWTWAAFRERMRLGRMGKREWLWTLGCILVMGVLSVLVSIVLMMVFKAISFQEPVNIAPPGAAQWLVVVGLTFNILGEELWWRGYIQPRQELRFGRLTWVVQGILWAWFHAFKWWVVPGMMVTCLVIPYVAQRTKNTIPGMITHFVLNGASQLLVIILVLLGVMDPV